MREPGIGAVIGIARLQQITGVTLRALRYYEAAGLLSAYRASNGARMFTPAQADTARTIVRLRRAEVTVAEIRKILDPARASETRMARVRSALCAKATELTQRLENIKSAVAQMDGDNVEGPPERPRSGHGGAKADLEVRAQRADGICPDLAR